jgi:hypothetical protein
LFYQTPLEKTGRRIAVKLEGIAGHFYSTIFERKKMEKRIIRFGLIFSIFLLFPGWLWRCPSSWWFIPHRASRSHRKREQDERRGIIGSPFSSLWKTGPMTRPSP